LGAIAAEGPAGGVVEDPLDERRLDRAGRAVNGGATRRHLVAGLASLLASGALPAAGAAAKPGKGAANGRAKGKGNGKGHGTENAPGRNRVAICHVDDETRTYAHLLVPAQSLKGHGKHGDILPGALGEDGNPVEITPAFCDGLNVEPEPEPDTGSGSGV